MMSVFFGLAGWVLLIPTIFGLGAVCFGLVTMPKKEHRLPEGIEQAALHFGIRILTPCVALWLLVMLAALEFRVELPYPRVMHAIIPWVAPGAVLVFVLGLGADYKEKGGKGC
jgi:hypothetical protein